MIFACVVVGLLFIAGGAWILRRNQKAPLLSRILEVSEGRLHSSRSLLLGIVLVGLGLALIFGCLGYWFPSYYLGA
uniref:Uncharacterized protein n=1 Tax=Hydrogenophaga sp. PL2G6 TaxID=503997 RepID=B4Y329_9BURK|nr:hypothetical protein [Hydrogenophaga sp. PL2G6]